MTVARGFIRKYPNIFEVFARPGDAWPWVRLSKAVLDLVEEEETIFRKIEREVVLKVRKLLMMCKSRRIYVGKLRQSRHCFGLPSDLATRVAPCYPQYFRVIKEGTQKFIELVDWDDSLAISELESRRKEEARKAGLGDIETRGQPLAFPLSYCQGMFLRKKFLRKKTVERLKEWQKLPYISPYQDAAWLKQDMPLPDKRVIAFAHEILSLTIERRAPMAILNLFHEDLGLPKSIAKAIHHFPGIFYLSLQGSQETAFLREAYDGAELLESHPLIRLKNKYVQMLLDGRKVHSSPQLVQEIELHGDFEEDDDEENFGYD